MTYENCKNSKMMLLNETDTHLPPEIWNTIASYVGKTVVASLISLDVINCFNKYNKIKKLRIKSKEIELELSRCLMEDGDKKMHCFCHNISKINGYVHKEILASSLEHHLKSKRHKNYIIRHLKQSFPTIVSQTQGSHL
jgi:DNA gyrase/topoisomerase IV subunit B